MGPENTPRILVACHPNIGDVVGTTPLFRWIRKAHPNAFVVALTSSLARPLLTGNPHLDEVWERPRKNPVAMLKFIAKLKRANFGVALVTYGHNDTMRMCRFAGIGRRVVVGPVKPSVRPTQEFSVPPNAPTIPTTISLLAAAIDVLRGSEEPDLFVPSDAVERVDELLRQADLSAPIVTFQLGASAPEKLWLDERFQAVWESIPLPAVIIGGPGEVEISRIAAARSSKPPLVLAGQLSLMESAAVLKRAKLLVTNDTGMMHLAAAVGTKVVAIYRNGMRAGHPPFGAGHALFEGRCECNPPSSEACTRACMRSVAVESVLEATLDRI